MARLAVLNRLARMLDHMPLQQHYLANKEIDRLTQEASCPNKTETA